MPGLFILILVLASALWFASEFQGRIWLRILIGILTLVVVGCSAFWLGSVLESFGANHYFAEANKVLIGRIISDMEEGRDEQLLAELKTLNHNYQPSYETRSDLDVLVDDFVRNMQEANPSPDFAP